MSIGQALKAHREKNGLSQTKLAQDTGIKQQNISRWENDTHIPNVLQCITLAKYYGITIEELVGVEELLK